MNPATKKQLIEWADIHESKAFITDDPIQFPHRFDRRQDIEVAGLLTAWISFGNRKMICNKANELLDLMNNAPFEYVMSRKWESDFPPTDETSFYRTCPKKQIFLLFEHLYKAYENNSSLEVALQNYAGSPRERLCQWLGVSTKSPQKKMNMYLRWMIRRNSPVDFGIWAQMDPKDLIIPLDTHVNRMAFELKLTDKTSYSLKQAIKITNALKDVFPEDPCKGDFALFGYGVEHSRHHNGSTSK